MQPTPMRTIMLCVEDDGDLLCVLQTVLMANGYAVLATNDGLRAPSQMPGRRLDAVVLCSMADSVVAQEMKRVRPQTPVIMFSGSLDVPSSTLTYVDAIVADGEGSRPLLATLQRLLQTESQEVRKYTRHRVQFPFGVTVNRSEGLAILHGVSTSLGEGGIGGRVDGNLVPGECVQLQINDSRLGTRLESRAHVRYRKTGTYGFAFLDITPPQQAEVQRLCALPTSA
jgi:CheY-like chemotaxis protein